MLDQLLRQADATRGVQGVVEGAPVEVASHHAALPSERIGLAEELLREPLVARGREHPDGGFEALRENDSIGQRRAEPRRNREAVLRVEVVLVLTEKRQVGFLQRCWFGAGRGGEVGGTSSPRPYDQLGPPR